MTRWSNRDFSWLALLRLRCLGPGRGLPVHRHKGGGTGQSGLLEQEGLTSRESQAGTKALLQKRLKLQGVLAKDSNATIRIDRGS